MTTAFQPDAFQVDAFQMGSDAPPAQDQQSLISDGNDSVLLLQEQDLSWPDQGTVSQDPVEYPTQCVFPTVASTVYANSSSGATISITMPAGVSAGDLLTVFIGHDNGNAVSPNSANPNWNRLFSTNSTTPNGAFFWKIADGSEGASQSFDRASGTAVLSPYIVYRITGADPRGPVAGSVANFTASSQPPSSLDPPWGPEPTLWLAPNAYDSTSATISTYPTGFTSNQTVQTSATSNYSLTLPTYLSSDTSLSPSSWVMSTSTNLMIGTLAVKGACNVPSYPVSAINDGEQTFFDDTEYVSETRNVPPEAGPGPCVPPAATVTSYALGSSSLTHNIPLPAGIAVGDRVYILAVALTSSTMSGSPFPSGWSQFFYGSGNNVSFAFKDYEYSDGASVTLTLSSTSDLHAYIIRLAGGTYDPTVAPGNVTEASATSTTPDAPSASTSWGADETLWVAISTNTAAAVAYTGYPSNMPDNNLAAGAGTRTAFATTTSNASSFDPATFTLASSTTWRARTFAIKGSCFPVTPLSITDNDDQDFTDTADYGFVDGPVSGDAVVVFDDVPAPSLDDQDATDLSDYSFFDGPVGDDNNPDVSVEAIALDEQDFTDDADYGFVDGPVGADFIVIEEPVQGIDLDVQDFTDDADYGFFDGPVGDDNNPEVSVEAISLDEQDLSDLEEYGFVDGPVGDDNNPDVSVEAISLDEQDFTDDADYGFVDGPVGPDPVVPGEVVLGLIDNDDQDFTDLADYGFVDGPVGDDNNPEIVVTADVDNDDQDWTDLADYGFQDGPVGDDNNPEVSVAAVALDDQDFTDLADYGDVQGPVGADNNPDIAPPAVVDNDSQDFTDFDDYGTQISPATPDVQFEDWLWGIDNDDQDFTDTADYGFVSDPVGPDNNPLIAPSAIALDDQDFTDFADYGSQYEPVPEDVQPPAPPPGPGQQGTLEYGFGAGIPGFGQKSIRLPDEINDLMRRRRLELKRRMKQLRENERRKRLLLAMIHALGILDDE